MARVDSGPVEASHKFAYTQKADWPFLVRAKRTFLQTQINYDCRCLVEFCEEAELVWEELGYDSAADMIRNGYELDPVEVELAVAWIKHNDPQAEIGIADVASKVAAARDKPLAEHGGDRKSNKDQDRNSTLNQDRSNDYTLRRLARDNPELLDEIEAGQLTVNAAAIKAGIRKKPSQSEVCIKAFRKAENRLEVLNMIVQTLEPHEVEVVSEWLEAKR